tara:strand:- start:2816 stop:2995 length:180 start_codon:yes stop_codon:yes gene_type:complete
MYKNSAYPVPVVKTRGDFVSGKKTSVAKATFPGHLPKPPVPEYTQEEIFSGILLNRYRD